MKKRKAPKVILPPAGARSFADAEMQRLNTALPEFPGMKRFSVFDGPPKEAVNHPAHYSPGPLEVINVIEHYKLGFCLGNVVKYVLRAEHKGATLQDLEKGLWYLQREITNRKKG